MADGYTETYRELIETTDWSKYGRGTRPALRQLHGALRLRADGGARRDEVGSAGPARDGRRVSLAGSAAGTRPARVGRKRGRYPVDAHAADRRGAARGECAGGDGRRGRRRSMVAAAARVRLGRVPRRPATGDRSGSHLRAAWRRRDDHRDAVRVSLEPRRLQVPLVRRARRPRGRPGQARGR